MDLRERKEEIFGLLADEEEEPTSEDMLDVEAETELESSNGIFIPSIGKVKGSEDIDEVSLSLLSGTPRTLPLTDEGGKVVPVLDGPGLFHAQNR